MKHKKGGGLFPQKNLSCFTFHAFWNFLLAVSRQSKLVFRLGTVPNIVVSPVPENVTTCCGQFRKKLIVLHNLKERLFIKTMQI